MASTNITLNEAAYERMKKLKQPGQSFSEVVLEHLWPPPCETAGELLESLRANPPPAANPELMKAVKAGKGRRSRRSQP